MNKTTENSPRTDARDEVIVLGVASLETKGILNRQETMGGTVPVGIAEE
jgi:hypothetical protein